MSMTSAQYAVAVGTATPEQRKIAKKQRRFIVVKTPYYPTVEDMMEAVAWLANRGFGKAPQGVFTMTLVRSLLARWASHSRQRTSRTFERRLPGV